MTRTATLPDYTDLKALFINCTVKRSPQPSNTRGLIDASAHIMREDGISTLIVALRVAYTARLPLLPRRPPRIRCAPEAAVNIPDDELVERLRAGDERAFADLVDRYTASMLAVARCMSHRGRSPRTSFRTPGSPC